MDEVTLAKETATAPAVSPAAEAAAKAKADRASAEKWAAKAVEGMNKKGGDKPAEEPKADKADADKAKAKAKPADDKPKEKARDESGRYVADKPKEKTDAKADAAKEAAPAAEAVQKPAKPAARGDSADGKGGADSAEAPQAAPEPLVGSLGKAKRLVREGDVAGALKLIDLDIDKIPGGVWASMRKHSQKREAELVAAHEAVQRDRDSMKAEARALVEELRPLAEAKQAAESRTPEGEERAFQLVFGKSSDEWQREKLARMHRGDLSKDPAVVEAQKLAKEAREEADKLRRFLHEREEAAAAEKSHQEYLVKLKSNIAEHADERVAAAAEFPWFVKMVCAERLKHWEQSHNGTTITEEEAIEAVFDPERLTAAQWQQLTGGQPTGKRDPGTKTQEATDRRGIDVKRAKAPTTLTRSTTVEAAPERRRTEKESMDYWSAKAEALAKEGKFGRPKQTA